MEQESTAKGGCMVSDSSSAIDSLFSARREAFLRKDVAALVEMLDEDYELWVPDEDARGAAQIRDQLAATFAVYDVDPSYEREEGIACGDLAFERGWDVQRLVPVQGGSPVTRRQRVFLVLRRHADGLWRFARGMTQPGPSPEA